METYSGKRLAEIIDSLEESVLAPIVQTAFSVRLAHLQQQRDQIAQQIAATEAQLKAISGRADAAPKRRIAARAKPRTSEIIRQTLRAAAGPLPLDAIVKAVAKATGKPLTVSLRSYVGQLLMREPAAKRLSRGLYAIGA
jgi:predicted nucleic acid-binding protein